MKKLTRAAFLSLVVAIFTLSTSTGARQSSAPREAWVGAWGWVASPPAPGVALPVPAPPTVQPLGLPPSPPAAPARPLLENPGQLPMEVGTPAVANITLRQIMRVSAAGRRVRLRMSNESSADVQVLGAVRVGIAGPDGTVMLGTDRAVTFDGQSRVAIPAGAPILSDPIDLAVKALDTLAVSIYVPDQATVRGARTRWTYAPREPGDFTGRPSLPGARLMRAAVYVTLIEVEAPDTNVIVAFGDSITEGDGSTGNAFRSWPDRLAERLAALPGPTKWAVVNAGIAGNRVLRTNSGPNALARFDRDVLSVPGVKVVILLEGINDIGRGFAPTGAVEAVTPAALQAAYKQIVARAHAHGIRVIGATLAPYKGAFYYSPAGEAARQAVNTWIKTGGVFDGVIDFASALGDPADPLTFAPAFNDRDKLHPNDAGYKAMADAIDLRVVTGQ